MAKTLEEILKVEGARGITAHVISFDADGVLRMVVFDGDIRMTYIVRDDSIVLESSEPM